MSEKQSIQTLPEVIAKRYEQQQKIRAVFL